MDYNLIFRKSKKKTKLEDIQFIPIIKDNDLFLRRVKQMEEKNKQIILAYEENENETETDDIVIKKIQELEDEEEL